MKYEDIIDMPHHVSEKRPQMSRKKRAAQFVGFRALRGFEDKFAESVRTTEERREITEDRAEELNRAFNMLREAEKTQPEIRVTYFKPDSRKSGGEYLTVTGNLRFIDMAERLLRFTDGRSVPIQDIYEITLL